MKKRLLAILIGVVLILTLAFTPVSAAKPGAVLPGGVGAGPLFHWRYQTGVTAASLNYWLYEELCNDINLATGGRLYIDLLPTGALVTGFETFDATLSGACEMTTS